MNKIAKALLDSQAVHIRPTPAEFFTWTSGRRSPIYCDNRQLISYPEYRQTITEHFVRYIKDRYKDVELIAGTATAGIPWAAWIADALNLPMVYIRSKPKGHGLKSAIEGKISAGQKTLIIEDLISTGKSSLEAVEHAKQDELNVLAVLSIFTYEFADADQRFKEANLTKYSLCTLTDLLHHAQEHKLLNESDVKTVLEWKNTF